MKKFIFVFAIAVFAGCSADHDTNKPSLALKRFVMKDIDFSLAIPANYSGVNLRHFLVTRLPEDDRNTLSVDDRLKMLNEIGLTIYAFQDTVDDNNVIMVFYDKSYPAVEITRNTAGYASTVLKESILNSGLLPNIDVEYNTSKLSIKPHFSHLKISGTLDAIVHNKLECYLISTKRRSLTVFSVSDKELNLQDYINNSIVK